MNEAGLSEELLLWLMGLVFIGKLNGFCRNIMIPRMRMAYFLFTS